MLDISTDAGNPGFRDKKRRINLNREKNRTGKIAILDRIGGTGIKFLSLNSDNARHR